MSEIPAATLSNFCLFLTVPFLFALVLRRFKISPVVGYILGGLFLGNFFDTTFSRELINNFAYFGIILLLFTIGLEVNFDRLIALKKFIILGGTLQILLSIVLIALISWFFSFSVLQSFVIGIALCSSSTALVAKIIQDRGEEGSFLGELAMGILMFQNIAFIPFLIILTLINGQSVSLSKVALDVFLGIVEASAIIFVLFYLGKKIIPIVFNKITKISKELLNLFVIIFIFFITYISTVLHIPIFVGIFVAGVLVGQTFQHYHIFSEVRPLRDLLAVIFFVFIGLSVKLGVIFTLIPKILLFTGSIMLVKALIILIIFLFFRFHSRTAFSLAMYLFQIDEDAFILMSQSFSNKVFSLEQYTFIITSVLLTLVVTPIIIANKDKIYYAIRKFIKKYLPFLGNWITYRVDRDQAPIDVIDIKDHVVICGYGRVGGHIGRALSLANIPFIAVDYNYQVVEKAKKEGVNIIYGDPTDMEILDYVQTDMAKVLVIAVPEKFSQESIVINAKKLNKKIVIFTRIHREQDQVRMKDLGVDIIIQPEFEASLSIIRRILYWHGLDKEEISRKIKRLKLEHGMI